MNTETNVYSVEKCRHKRLRNWQAQSQLPVNRHTEHVGINSEPEWTCMVGAQAEYLYHRLLVSAARVSLHSSDTGALSCLSNVIGKHWWETHKQPDKVTATSVP